VKPVFTKSVGTYRQALTEQETDTITAKLYSGMRCLNYLSEEEYQRISQTQLTKKAQAARAQ